MIKALSRPGFPPPALPSDGIPPMGLPYRIGGLALLGLAAAAGLLAPARYGPAALALAVALGLEAASRLATRAASQRAGRDVAIRGQPSLILALTGVPLVPAAALAVLMLLDADRFPLAASLVAGLTAMAALARLAVVRTVALRGRPEGQGRSGEPARSGEADGFTAR